MASAADVDLDEVYSFALDLGKTAGKILDDGWRARCSGGGSNKTIEKDSAVDIVTQTDEGELDLLDCLRLPKPCFAPERVEIINQVSFGCAGLFHV